MFYKSLNYCIVVYMACCLVSCAPRDEWTVLDATQSSKKLSVEDTLYLFDQQLPINLALRDAHIFVNFARSPQALSAIDIQEKSLIDSFGNIGHGPGEVIGPEFMVQMDDSNLILADVNSKQILGIALDSVTMKYSLVKRFDYPEEIYPASDVSISKNFMTGRNLRSADAMFFIYNKNSKQVIDIPCYPYIKDLESRRNYFYAVRTAINEKANRIIAASYFFNMFHVYTLGGDHIQTYALSEDPISTIDIKTKEIDISAKYTGIQAVFPTESHCYMLVTTKNNNVEENAVLVQCDWDGKLINSYQIEEEIAGGFCIEKNQQHLYAISQEVNSEGNEVQAIVSYLLH